MPVEIRIRVARPAHKPLFLHLWKAFMQIHEKLGGDIKATDRSLRVYGSLFDAYVTGRLKGVALIAYADGEPCGALLFGMGTPPSFDIVGEEKAIGWGVYVDRSHQRQGISTSLYERAGKELALLGIEKVSGAALVSNEVGIQASIRGGFIPEQILLTLDLSGRAT